MIPIRDINPSDRTPVVNYLIIMVSAAAFLFELSLGSRLEAFLNLFGLVPARYGEPDMVGRYSLALQAIPFISSMFLHGGWLHLIGNMWTLYIFGDNIEARLGHVKYLVFYLLSGFAAAFIQIVTNPESTIPTIGASGAIAGVMGAYFVLYPRAKVLTLVPIIFFFTFVELPAFLFLGIWFFMQFLSGTVSMLNETARFSGVAWWAHVGGFVGGIVLLLVFRPRRIDSRLRIDID
ncbi:MAG: rhomboid family intramembrane serine protease [Acidobacteriota bacterium]